MGADLHPDLRDPPEALPIPDRAMTIGAHPDDAEFGAGATLARWADAGTEITLVVVTDGSKGSWDAGRDPQELAAQRRIEQRCAADALGVTVVEHLGYTDGELEYAMALRESLSRLIRVHRPDVVLTHDPWQRYQLHPDHRITGFVAVDSVVAARDPLFYPEQGIPAHRPGSILLWSTDEPDHVEPTTPTAVDRKIQALLCHTSQSETTMADAAASDEQRRVFAVRIESRLGSPPAEVFKRLVP
jgi:LmbE family N-acetylglucosaminyl deacetylase